MDERLREAARILRAEPGLLSRFFEDLRLPRLWTVKLKSGIWDYDQVRSAVVKAPSIDEARDLVAVASHGESRYSHNGNSPRECWYCRKFYVESQCTVKEEASISCEVVMTECVEG